MHNITEKIIAVFEARGKEKYGSEAVTQLQHALQTALLAEEAKAEPALITAALLHDIGHILHEEALPTTDSENLDDFHEEVGYQWLLEYFGEEVAAPVKLHVEAKRYLCTIDETYEQNLSPTSLKSYYDQGGKMKGTEKEVFESNPFFEPAVLLRRWDDLAKEADKETPGIEHFAPYIEECLR